MLQVFVFCFSSLIKIYDDSTGNFSRRNFPICDNLEKRCFRLVKLFSFDFDFESRRERSSFLFLIGKVFAKTCDTCSSYEEALNFGFPLPPLQAVSVEGRIYASHKRNFVCRFVETSSSSSLLSLHQKPGLA